MDGEQKALSADIFIPELTNAYLNVTVTATAIRTF